MSPSAVESTYATLLRRVAEAPFYVDDVATHLLSGLAVEILYLSTLAPSFSSLNKGAWKSTEDVLDAAPSLRELHEILRRDHLGGRDATGWAMVNRAGSYHPRHRHPSAKVCGIYYVTEGDPAVPTIFEVTGGSVSVEPIPGRLVLFSGDMHHRVPRYDGEAPRITIAFDVRPPARRGRQKLLR